MSALLSWDLFVASEPWKRLTNQQQMFVRVLIATGDTKAAVRIAYPAANAHSRIVMASSMPQSTRVRAALAYWGGPAKRVQEIFDHLVAENQQLQTENQQLATEARELKAELAQAAKVLFEFCAGTSKSTPVQKPEPVEDPQFGDVMPTFWKHVEAVCEYSTAN